MRHEDRKAAITAYKERKAVAGIYELGCRITGERWVGRAPDLATVQNRLWFTLRHGSHSHAGLQAAWNRHGPAAFALTVLERLEEEKLAYVREKLLKERLDHWRREREAAAI
ncbi:GIY-YIG nuclease family protein [Labrys wisconsinensis]|uniref:GIY-YIG nuclease family protein n=1 Tax=Labrys wisconsinensis TaxID=425677 RepID=A0ABU0IZB6_9HYPH|nr:GIY-YIG nuclease family protein [Labrys wisconsinensis]MDQ0467362.1 hypothetical protein [Labrys wisconsinensis]